MTAGRSRLQPLCAKLAISRRGKRLEEELCRLFMGHLTDRTADSSFGGSYRFYDEIESTNVDTKSL